MTGKVYFVKAGGMVKIGFTQGSVEKRVAALQTGSPHKLKLLGAVAGSYATEREYHLVLRDARGTGEWFSLKNPKVMWAVRESLRSGPSSVLVTLRNQQIERRHDDRQKEYDPLLLIEQFFALGFDKDEAAFLFAGGWDGLLWLRKTWQKPKI